MNSTMGIRNVSNCSYYDIPSVKDYLNAANGYGITLLCYGALALIVVLFMYIDTLRYVIQNSSPSVKAGTAFVLSVYPVACLASFFAILVPRSYLLSEAVTQGMFMSGMYQLFCLFVSYCGGYAALIKMVKPNKLSLKVGPCCCYPCCSFLPTYEVKKKTVKYLKLSVLQLPLVQGLVYVILLVMWAEAEFVFGFYFGLIHTFPLDMCYQESVYYFERSLFQVNYMYLQPIIIISILFGIWGISMTMNILKDTLNPEFMLLRKFFVLQMVLVFAKLQGITTRALVWYDNLPCNPPITPQVYAIIIHNTLMMTEMILLGYLARKLYKRHLPGVQNLRGTLGSIIPTISTSYDDKSLNKETITKGYSNNGFEMSN